MYLVTQFKVKRDASGNITKYKARTCVADIKKLRAVPGTYSPAVASSSRRMQGQLLAVLKGATSDQNDVANAYYRGTPLRSYDKEVDGCCSATSQTSGPSWGMICMVNMVSEMC